MSKMNPFAFVSTWTSAQIFRIRAVFAKAAYARRQKQRNNRRFPVRWFTPEAIMLQDIAYIRDEDGDEVIGKEFLNTMSEARKPLADSVARRSAVSLTIGVYIALTVLGVDFPVTLGGFELRHFPGLTEGLLVLADLIGLSAIARIVNLSILTSAVKGAIITHVPEPVRYYYRSAMLNTELPLFFQPSYLPHILWGPAKIFFSKLYVMLAVAFVVSIPLVFIAFRLWVFAFILQNPSISVQVSIVAVALTVALDAISIFLIWVFLLPLPHRDWQLLQQMELSEQFSPDGGQALRRETYREDVEDQMDMERKGYVRPQEPEEPEGPEEPKA